MYISKILQVIITTPGDVPASCIKRVIDSISEWNRLNSKTRRIVLMPVRWDTDVHAFINNEEPQKTINTQIASSSDVLIGIFWTRIGTPTKQYKSGSVEEIEKHVNDGKPAMLYFLNKSIPPEMLNNESAKEQYKRLSAAKKEWSGKGLIKEIRTNSNIFFNDLSLLLTDNNKEIRKVLHSDDLIFDSLIKDNCQFRYHFLPSPDGERVWYRKSTFRWIEKSPHSPIPDKVYLCYSESDSVVQGVRGIVVQCVTRDEEIGFQVFIPEKNEKDMWLYCRIVNKRGSDWERLGVSPIEYF